MNDSPDKLAAAICSVMSEVKRLSKADNNAFQKYKFTSVDDMKDHIRPLLAKNGLSIRTDEVAFEAMELIADSGKKSLVARYKFSFQLVHVSGAVDVPEHSTITLPYTGAQTTGAARSYAAKEWFKSKFLVSTGDISEDADTHEQQSYSKTLPKAKARDEYKKLQDSMRDQAGVIDSVAFIEWGTQHKSDIALQPEDWQAELRKEYATLLATMKDLETADRQSVRLSPLEAG
jgi:hypothetical protein